MGRRGLQWVVLIGMLAVLAEVGSFAALAVVERVAPYLVYRIPPTPRERYDGYLLQRHPVLGWQQHGSDDHPSPRPSGLPGDLPPCALVYGDSFAYGLEVEDAEAWPELLARRLGCRVENWAVPGFGVDQALMMFEMTKQRSAPVAVLGIWPEDIMRSLNRWQYLITVGAQAEYTFKPRFVLRGGDLVRLEMPQLTYDDYQACARRPEACLQDETFLPDTAEGPVRKTFPYSLSLLRLMTGRRMSAFVIGKASWEHVVQPGAEGAALTEAMLRRFRDEAAASGHQPLVVLFPTVGSARIFAKNGRSATAPIAELTTAMGLPVLDLHQPLHEADADFCSLLISRDRCGGHLNARGNAAVADILAPTLRRMTGRLQ